jgi:putative ABC transport system permease protein
MTDLRYALRVLGKSPGFTAVAVLSLALGIGASTAVFTIVDRIVLRPLNFAEPQRLAVVSPTSGAGLSARVSPAYLDEWRRQSRAFADMAGWEDVRMNSTGDGPPIEVQVDRATANFFSLLGTPALVGRTFAPGRTLTAVAPEVVLSHGFWQRRYGGDPAAIGRRMMLDGRSFTIVGVMPSDFAIRTNELAQSHAEAWIACPLLPGNRFGMAGSLNAVGRLAPGSTPEQAAAELTSIARTIERAYPSYSRDWGVNVIPLHEATVKDVRARLFMLLGAVGILLSITCANIATLVLSRAASRRGEIAVRLSLGATRARLVRQFLTESLVLASAGGTLGLLLATWGTALFAAVAPASLDLPRTREIAVDWRIAGFALLVTALAAIVFGLFPSIGSTGVPARASLAERTRAASGGPGRNVLRSALIVSQVAFALVLLTGAALLGRSVLALNAVAPGFQAEQVVTMRTTLPASKYATDDRVRGFARELQEALRVLPGVVAAGHADYLPLTDVAMGNSFDIAGRARERDGDRPFSFVATVGGDYFAAMGIPLIRGRLFAEADTRRTRPVAIIDAELARRYWPDSDPIGARLLWDSPGGEPREREVIGVVGSVRYVGMAADPNAMAYFWFPQQPGRDLSIVARTLRDSAAAAGAIAGAVRAIDPDQPVAQIRAMRDVVADDLSLARFTSTLLGFFAVAAVLLAALGLYGVIAFAVARRTREVGIRVALGARPGDIVRLLMRHALALTGAGLAIGVPAALGFGRALRHLLFGVSPHDPAVVALAVVLLAAVAALAAYLPARRALRVEPLAALRAE